MLVNVAGDLLASHNREYDVEPPYDIAAAGDLPEDRFSDRELSWLAFNQRVLELAENDTVPLLERAKFLAIFASNLDEFYMVRIAGLKRRIAAGVAVKAASGLLPREVLDRSLTRSRELMDRQADTWRKVVQPALIEQGIDILRWDELEHDEREEMTRFFRDRVFPVLTPLAVDPSHPFPYISGLSLNLAVVVRNPDTGGEHFARVKVPPLLPRFVQVAEGRFVPLEDVIAVHLDQLFPGMEVTQHHTFRVTRNEDLEVEEDDAENLLVALEKELLRRRFGPPVRLEVEESIDPQVRALLLSELGVTEAEVFELPGPLDLRGLFAIAASGPRRAEVPGVRPVDPPAPGRGGDLQPGGHVPRAQAARRTGAPPVRLVLDQRAAVHRAGGRRSARAGDQADAVPHQR